MKVDVHAVAMLCLLVACGDKDEPGSTDESEPAADGADGGVDDTDGDGVPDGEDCAPDDPSVFPGADEACNGVDDDCDDEVDEGATSTFHADADGDGFGDPGATTEACSPPEGYTTDARDCDDADADVNPDATEVCNGIDDDCDGSVDPDSSTDASTWYADADGDGFGDPGATTEACSPPEGYTTDARDCDDADADVNPDATEVCNGFDDDCDGSVDPDSSADAPRWYTDGDGDGFGDAGSTAVACTQPSGTVADATDCDDTDAGVHPDATEVCNGVDDDCDGSVDPDTSADAATWYADTDGDGYGDLGATTAACTQPTGYLADATDCDDTDANVNPGATEVCNSVDDDCDGSVDPDTSADAATWYADADRDGYGDSSTTSVSCSAPSGYLADATDCDDTDASVNPGAAEVCNGVDDDCNGADDDNATDASSWYPDADGDGYGDLSSVQVECTQPTGTVADATDCDDTSATVYPGAEELCWDGVDRDCDGAAASDTDCAPEGVFTSSDRDATVSASATDFGLAVAVGDVSSSRPADILITSSQTGSGNSAAWLFPGSSTTTPSSTSSAYLWVTGASSGSSFGASAAIGDLNDDGWGDLVIGASTDSGDVSRGGRVYIYATGSTVSGAVTASSTHARVGTTQTSAAVGSAVASGGDLDGDGVDDLVVGAPGASWYDEGIDPGAAYVFLGPITGSLDVEDADHALWGELDSDRAGAAVDIAPDLDGDGLDDLLIGAPSNDAGGFDAGAAYAFLGGSLSGATRLVHAPLIVRGAAEDDALGTSVAGVGDVNADGWGDLLIGAPYDDTTDTDAGAAGLFFGPPGAGNRLELANADLLLLGEAAGDHAGAAVSGAGDSDGDGYADLLVSAPARDSGAGVAYMVWGATTASTLDLGSATAEVEGTASGETGAALAAGDTDGDGYSDLVVGAPGASEWALVLGGARVQTAATAPSPDPSTDDDGDGYSEDAGDCDDRRSAISPAASETCGDGLDDDCDGHAQPCAPSSTIDQDDPWAYFYGGGEGDVQIVGDLNDDGWDDLGIRYLRDRAVHIHFGPQSPGPRATEHANVRITGPVGTGLHVSPAGDVNGDGIDDLLFSAYLSSNVTTRGGEAWIVYGDPDLSGDLSVPTDADVVFEPEGAGDYLGYGLDGGGDFDGDGQADVALGAPFADGEYGETGVAYVFAGPITSGTYNVSAADYRFEGEMLGHELGTSVAFAGDTDGDGADDLILGAPEHHESSGAAYLVMGGQATGTTDLRHVLRRFEGNNDTGTNVSGVGDLDADGYADIAVASVSDNSTSSTTGSVHVYYGPLHVAHHDVEDADATIDGPSSGDQMGLAISAAGDVDADGRADLLVGAPRSSAVGYQWGGAWLFYGPVSTGSLTTADADVSFTPTASGRAGRRVGVAGDVDGDGYDDLVVCLGSANDSTMPWYLTANSGAVTVHRGGARSGVTAVTASTPVPTDDADGDGYTEDDGDCDDSRAAVSPAEVEVCENDLDDDCSGTDAWCLASGLTAPVSEPEIQAGSGDLYGRGLALIDLDGDGFDDLVAGGPGADLNNSYEGVVFVAWGPVPRGSIDATGAGRTPDLHLTGAAGYDRFGSDLAPIADMDGDGTDDLAVGAYTADAVYLITDVTAGGSQATGASVADTTVTGTSGSNFGAALASGDLDGDGVADLLVAAPHDSTTATWAGAIYSFFGPFTAASLSTSDADAVFDGSHNSEQVGEVRQLGDVDGDGLDDILIGAGASYGSTSTASTGQAYLFYGAVSLASAEVSGADVVFEAEAAGDAAGTSVSILPDTDGDGLDEVLIGAPNSSASAAAAGATYLLYGGGLTGTVSLATADLRYLGTTRADRAGGRVGPAGDVNNDGAPDLLIGATYDESLFLVLGPLTGSGDVSLSGAQAEFEQWGPSARIAYPGDHHGDGYDDIVVAADDARYLWISPGGE